MDTLIGYPENKEQLDALKSVIRLMKINFEEKREIYPGNVVRGVKDSLLQSKNEELTSFTGVEKMLSEK